MLYRVRCLFPDVCIGCRDAYELVWHVLVRHKQSGIILLFSEHKGALGVHTTYDGRPFVRRNSEAEKAFITDAVRLLNTFFKTVDGKRFAYFHPAAEADFPAGNEKYLAVPVNVFRKRVKSWHPHYVWISMKAPAKDMSSLQSLLPSMTYNAETRKVDAISGSVDLTSVISSSLLFYRLQCNYPRNHIGVNCPPPITSIWQVKLVHVKTGVSIIFMDDHGLFDIQAGEDAKKVMDDIVALVSDECTHPYDGLVAGCVA